MVNYSVSFLLSASILGYRNLLAIVQNLSSNTSLDFASAVWSPYKQKHMEQIESVKRRVTKPWKQGTIILRSLPKSTTKTLLIVSDYGRIWHHELVIRDIV